ncbi:MAG TPA: HEPN domain-containing protein [Puia sp.]|uniref:HEPN domain-containing protein n=1 Tax=Puia sp. TaxID=2045100 RepID=UPI002CD1860F|nr:HEPN domain-containing protein [Puia sp.]HVU96600.1 HEPN domain-containing protein [Puia sp.]
MTTFQPNTSLHRFSPKQRHLLERLVPMIVRAVHVEKIVLYGGSDPALPPSLVSFDLLIITREDERRSDYELQDIIENRCRETAAVTALVHDIAYVNKKLQERQYFFSTVLREGTLLYDARRTPLADAGIPDWEEVRMMAEKDFDRWTRVARDFFHSAEFIRGRRSWNTATFFLHQAAEQCYQAILLTFMGYKPTTHNLDKLRRYTNRFSVELALLFPLDNEEEEDLFRLLSSGYVSARYKEEFIITEREVSILTERIRRLLDIAERVCCNHFINLGKRAAKGD